MITPLDLDTIVAEFSSDTLTLERPTHGYNSAGLRTKSVVTTTIKASFQPITGAELERLPEGFGDKTLFSVWSVSELKLRDRITVNGIKYEVQHLDNWLGNGKYYKAIVQQLDGGELV